MKKKALIVAHPDDEVIWFPADIFDVIVVVFCDRHDKPWMGSRRRLALQDHPLRARIHCLDIEESGYWKDKSRRQVDEQTTKAVKTALLPWQSRLDGYDIYTHGADGEYGHSDHTMIHHTVVELFAACHMIYTPAATSALEDCEVPCNRGMSQDIVATYQDHGCWTWQEPFEAPASFHFERYTAHDPIIAGIASFPAREPMLERTVASILPQVDHLYVYLNGYKYIPSFLAHAKVTCLGLGGDDLGDIGKFMAPNDGKPVFYLTIDDDIIYPSGYATTMRKKLIMHGLASFVCVHENLLKAPIESSYYKEKRGLHFCRALGEDTTVDVPGTGTMIHHTAYNRFDLACFPQANMSDIWVYRYARTHTRRVVAIARPSGWLVEQQHANPQASIFWQSQGNESRQIAVINSHFNRTGCTL